MTKSRKFGALVIITVILTMCSGTLFAQDEEDEEHGYYLAQPKVFYGGVVAGINLTQIDGDYYAGYRKIGLNVGGIMYAQVKKHVAMSLEILYSEKGSRSRLPQRSPGNANVALVSYGIKNNYAEIPVMINYFDKRKSHFGIGVSYGRLVSSSEPIDAVDSLGKPIKPDLGTKYPFKKSELDFVAGTELHLWKGLFLNIRFQYSMLPVRTQIPSPTYARTNEYSNMWAVRLMYLIK